ncbi:MAG: YceI family protein, partial [Bacteroidetes bacterium]|nr:YceI family protein [Bacteroidota bacterium]
MKKSRTGFIAILAVTAFAFTTPVKKINYVIDTKTTTATWLAKKVTGVHTGSVNVTKGNITSDGKNVTGGKFDIDMTTITSTDLTD